MSTFQLCLFDDSTDLVVPATPAPSAAVAEVPRRPRLRIHHSYLFNLRSTDQAEAPADRFKWRSGETLADYTARTGDRRIRRDELPKDVRRVKGGAYQARPWIGPGRDANVNLGLFRPVDYSNDRDAAISAAARAAREFKKAMCHRGSDVWEVIQKLQVAIRFGRPVVPTHVLPPLVRRNGTMFIVKGRAGVFDTPAEAWVLAQEVFTAKARAS